MDNDCSIIVVRFVDKVYHKNSIERSKVKRETDGIRVRSKERDSERESVREKESKRETDTNSRHAYAKEQNACKR